MTVVDEPGNMASKRHYALIRDFSVGKQFASMSTSISRSLATSIFVSRLIFAFRALYIIKRHTKSNQNEYKTIKRTYP